MWRRGKGAVGSPGGRFRRLAGGRRCMGVVKSCTRCLPAWLKSACCGGMGLYGALFGVSVLFTLGVYVGLEAGTPPWVWEASTCHIANVTRNETGSDWCNGATLDVGTHRGGVRFELATPVRLPSASLHASASGMVDCGWLSDHVGLSCWYLRQKAQYAVKSGSELSGPLCFSDPAGIPPNALDKEFAEVHGTVYALLFGAPFLLAVLYQIVRRTCPSVIDWMFDDGQRYEQLPPEVDRVLQNMPNLALQRQRSQRIMQTRASLATAHCILPLLGLVGVIVIMYVALGNAIRGVTPATCTVSEFVNCSLVSGQEGRYLVGKPTCCAKLDLFLTDSVTSTLKTNRQTALATIVGKYAASVDALVPAVSPPAGCSATLTHGPEVNCWYEESQLRDAFTTQALGLLGSASDAFCPGSASDADKANIALFWWAATMFQTGAFYRVIVAGALAAIILCFTWTPCVLLRAKVRAMKTQQRRNLAIINRRHRQKRAKNSGGCLGAAVACCCCAEEELVHTGLADIASDSEGMSFDEWRSESSGASRSRGDMVLGPRPLARIADQFA